MNAAPSCRRMCKCFNTLFSIDGNVVARIKLTSMKEKAQCTCCPTKQNRIITGEQRQIEYGRDSPDNESIQS